MLYRFLHSGRRAGALTVCAVLAAGALAAGADASATKATAAACTNTGKLAGWSNLRLAMLTIAVPASETDPGQVTAEIAQGAGGVLLFGSHAPSDLGVLLTRLRSHVPGRLGLLVMTDEEGGGIQRMANLVGSLPWARTMGADWSAAQIQRAVHDVAVRMAAAGVNMDLAPVADVDGRAVVPSASNPDGLRAFSGNAAVVARDTVAYMNGLRSGGVIPVAKHFPGLGHASYNTDLGPAHTLPWSTEQAIALPPFKALIGAGVPAVMTSNASVPGLTTAPGSISATLITTELKGRLGFHGLVLTDSLSAKAISDAGWSVPGAAVQALRSGADMILFGPVSNPQAGTTAIADRIVAATKSGLLARSRLIDAAGAVLAVRHVNLCTG
ncbi:glycoside hydrolase family 3 N-terminal domain-containing protein [Streptacidiphilus jiangxiensis]|uniref:Beta-N-acetylhexosaminidase n=1 Tax=Streptacidiphilus jiangxiensis TaxID=235985 RepID=A0A1H7UJF3_STRJI|nr:glycoside hydrolase family 3 N-terminal domain-containing protein [Streptacidiphilus jiangxiensis]SEL97190.1 beta-N-acetylhexosaminidase [Streptacidiphilus jiangxiensis]